MNYNFRDRTGERYGKLTVIERAPDAVYPSAKLVRWLCRCDCGREKIIIGCNLKKTKSCGCDMYGHNLEDLTNQRFGILTAVKRVDNKVIPCGQNQTIWQCVCDCGSVVNVRAATLKNGDTQSCGCIKSHGERLVAEYLTQNKVSFRREYSFKDCTNQAGNVLKFDFAIMENDKPIALIEYQGQQHYVQFEKAPEFGRMQRTETDQIKKEYCSTHNILLFEIRFDDDIQNRIDEILKTLQDNTVPSSKSLEKV